MIRQRAQHIRYFFFSRHVSDAVLITAAVLIPSVFLARLGLYEIGAIVSVGALCVGVTDIPGPFHERARGMLVCNLILFFVALLTGYAGISVYLESAEIVLFCFLFSMFTLYGSRASSIGTNALMVMIIMMYKHDAMARVPLNALYLLAGGVWYTLLSFGFYLLMPYRQIQQVVGECILETTKSLRMKASLYNAGTDQYEGLNQLMLQQIITNEKQDDVRQLLFSKQWKLREGSHHNRLLTTAFVDLMDIYEQIVTTSYYRTIRAKFGQTGVLPVFESLLNHLADNLKNLGYAVQSNTRPAPWISTGADFILLKKKLDEIGRDRNEGTFILKKALITFRSIDERIRKMAAYVTNPSSIVDDPSDSFQYELFLTPRNFSFGLFKSNLSLRSSTFRYALRVSLVSIIGFAIARLVSGEGHSYWILFTVVFIIKPAFSLSKERNYQRIGGTLLGGLISFPIILYVHENTALFLLLTVFMIVAYTFMRINYLVFVIFMTCYVLLMFKLLGTNGLDIVEERVIDTLIGAGITFLAIYFVFPNWEFKQIRIYISEMTDANKNYLTILQKYFSGRDVTINDYRLARKDAYVGFANLAASFQRMMSEPKSKQRNIAEIQRFIIASHQLSSLISSNAAAIFSGTLEVFRNTSSNLRYIGQSVSILEETQAMASGSETQNKKSSEEPAVNDNSPVKSQMKLIREQAVEIRKTAQTIFK